MNERIATLRPAPGPVRSTIVVVTSDHGESFGEHGYLQHGPRVADAVMRVPLVIRLPRDHPSARPGRVVESLVRTVDIFPTLLDAVGAPVPESLDGRSLLPAIRGEPFPEAWAYGESGRSFRGTDPERHVSGVEGKHRMIRTADWKLVFVPASPDREYRLYDLRADPGEQREVADEHPGVVTRLRARFDLVIASEAPRPEEPELSAEEFDVLREPGYLD